MKTALMDKLIMQIYREMYAVSEPIADFDKLIETGEAKKEGFFNNYLIDRKIHDEIIERNIKNKRLSKQEKQIIRNTINLGCSPKLKN